MKTISFDNFRPGVTMEQITPYLPQEVANGWRLLKAGIVRENYARADEPGVVIVTRPSLLSRGTLVLVRDRKINVKGGAPGKSRSPKKKPRRLEMRYFLPE